MSANLVVDLGATCDYRASLVNAPLLSGPAVGEIVDFLGADTYCNLWATTAGPSSGQIAILIQTSDGVASGSFTDPTSGLPRFPTFISSGGIFWVNSGLYVSGWSSIAAPVNNAPQFCSGGIAFGAFVRPHRYARLVGLSGDVGSTITAGFVSNKRTIGSGGGSTQSPGSGTPSV